MAFLIHPTLTILGLWLLLMCKPVTAAVLIPNEGVQGINLAPYLELLEDPTQQLGIAQVSSAAYAPRFVPNTAAVPDAGRSHSTWWARFQLRADTPQEWYLLLDRPIGGSIEVFVLPARVKTHLRRLDAYRFPAYHLQLAAGETVSVYLRVTNGQALLTLPLKLLDAETLLTTNSREEILFAAMFAGMVVLALYNLLLFFSLREYSYLNLTLLLCASNLFFLRDTNLFPTLAWLNDSTQYFYTTPLLLMFVTGFQYWRYVNQGASRVIGFLCHWMPYLSVVALPVMGLVYRGEQVIFGIVLFLIPIFFVLTSLLVWRGHRPSRVAYGALIVLIIAVAPYSAMQVGWFTYDKTAVYWAGSGFLLTALLLSFVQAEQTRWLREEKERMEASSQAKDSFLTTMSHELRTPIHAIVGIADLLRQTVSSREQASYLDKLLASSRHLQTLVDDVLDLSRIGAGKLELETTVFRLDEELDTIQQMFSQPAAQKGLSLVITHDLPANLQVCGDPVRLKQVLVNLLSNALKFTAQGSVSLSVQQIVGGNEGQIRLYVEVVDTGIGISIHHQRRLFQPFSQAENSTTRRYGGSGLGLAISRKLVGLMGGKLEVNSEPENGSSFFFTLDLPVELQPVLSSKSSKASPPPFTGLLGKNRHVLLVDDDELNCYVGTAMLKRLGVKATVVESGQAALQQVQQQAFDLVMMDVSMPEMDGYTATRHIRRAGYTDLPIIAVTAHAIEEEYERCLGAGMDDYLCKPFDLEALHQMLLSKLCGDRQTGAVDAQDSYR